MAAERLTQFECCSLSKTLQQVTHTGDDCWNKDQDCYACGMKGHIGRMSKNKIKNKQEGEENRESNDCRINVTSPTQWKTERRVHHV